MTDNFWNAYNKKIMVLAPMEDVTDTVFREIVLSISDPGCLDVMFTEFTSTDGICDIRGRSKVMERLDVNQTEQNLIDQKKTKLVAQIWGSKPEKFYESAKIITESRYFDGIDINMGCPVKKVVKGNCCAALIKNPHLAKEIIFATMAGTSLPVSVKTRIGYHEINTVEWIAHLLETNPAAITLHGRTQKMMSAGKANWDEISKAVQLRNLSGVSTVIIGNGDVASYDEAMIKANQYGVDGVMVGTGIFKNPWFFNKSPVEVTVLDRIHLLIKHIELYRDTWGIDKNYNILKRFYKIYIHNFSGASEIREKLMLTRDYNEVFQVIQNIPVPRVRLAENY